MDIVGTQYAKVVLRAILAVHVCLSAPAVPTHLGILDVAEIIDDFVSDLITLSCLDIATNSKYGPKHDCNKHDSASATAANYDI